MTDTNAPAASGRIRLASERWKSTNVAHESAAPTSNVVSAETFGKSAGSTTLAQPKSVTAKNAEAMSLKRSSTRSKTRSSVESTAQAASKKSGSVVLASMLVL